MDERDEEIIARMRRLYDAFNRGDFDRVMEMAHPDIEVVRPGGLGVISGATAVRTWMEPDAFEKQVTEPLAFRVSGDKVVVHVRTRNRGAGSGIELEDHGFQLWTLGEDDLVIRHEFFFADQEAEALRAAGMADD
jgi:ketosteroid isomerase-like protein